MHVRVYLLLSGVLFSLVALAHLARTVSGWPILVDQWPVPMAISWLGFIVTALLAAWAFRLLGRAGTAD